MDQPNQDPKFRVSGPSPSPAPDIPHQPIYELSVENSRSLDALAVSEFGIPSIVLMENAAIGMTQIAIAMLTQARSRQIIIFAGPGNNAGDGFACARQLANRGLAPTIITTHDHQLTDDAQTNRTICLRMNLPMMDARAFVDANPPPPGLAIDTLFGTGLGRPIEGIGATCIDLINSWRSLGTLVLAADVPSGLDAQRGTPIGEHVVIADQTASMAGLKEGYRAIEAQEYLGQVTVVDIGAPATLLERLGTRIDPRED